MEFFASSFDSELLAINVMLWPPPNKAHLDTCQRLVNRSVYASVFDARQAGESYLVASNTSYELINKVGIENRIRGGGGCRPDYLAALRVQCPDDQTGRAELRKDSRPYLAPLLNYEYWGFRDSVHALAFSILHCKPFTIISRGKALALNPYAFLTQFRSSSSI